MKKIVLLAPLSALIASPAFAAADATFTATMTDVTANVGTYGAALVGLAALSVGFGVAIKYVRKIRSNS